MNNNIDNMKSFLKPAFILTLACAAHTARISAADILTARIADPDNGELLLADPTIFLLEGKYYMAGTQPGDPPGFNVLLSDDLITWSPASGNTKPQLAPAEDVYGTKWFWAPQFLPVEGKVYMFYTANEHVASAVADSIAGEYRATRFDNKENLTPRPEPIDGSCGNIDPFLFRDTDGKCYLYHVRFDNGNYLWVGEYDMDKGEIIAGTLRPTFRVDQPWEHTLTYESAPIMEGPTLMKIDDTYYLFYSANHYMSKDYAVGYATAPTPTGPWTKNPDNPVISRDIVGEAGSGHGDIFTDREGNLRYVFHTHNSEDHVAPRRTRIISLKMEKGEQRGAPARIVADPSTLLKPKMKGAHSLPTTGTL